MPSPANEFLDAFATAVERGTFISMTLSQPTGTSVKQVVRPVEIKEEKLLQWTSQQQQETHENLEPNDSVAKLKATLANFGGAHLFTAQADYALRKGRKGSRTLQKTRPSKSLGETAHDRTKHRLLPEGRAIPFLVSAGLMRPDGKIVKAKRAKYRQLNRFLELIDDVLKDLPTTNADGSERPLRVVEFGSGKSHLAFAVQHLVVGVRGRPLSLKAYDRDA